MKKALRLLQLTFMLLFVFTLVEVKAQATYPGLIGMNVSTNARSYLDIMRADSRAFYQINSDGIIDTVLDESTPDPEDYIAVTVPVDNDGWPSGNTDFAIVVFDERPLLAWLPEGDDDPLDRTVPMGGVYKLTFVGEASVRADDDDPGNTGVEVGTLDFDGTTTTVDITYSGTGLMILDIYDIQSTGISDIKLYQPGFTAASGIWHPCFIEALKPFSLLKFTGLYSEVDYEYGDELEWDDRRQQHEAYKDNLEIDSDVFKAGLPWEDMIELVNQAESDNMWINIPASASNDYITELAELLLDSIDDASTKIYVEYTYEHWFSNTIPNSYMIDAVDPNSGLIDGATGSAGAVRYYLLRSKQISEIFKDIYENAGRDRDDIRVVVSASLNDLPSNFETQLQWLDDKIQDDLEGFIDDFIYGIGFRFELKDAPAQSGVQDIIDNLNGNMVGNREAIFRTPLVSIADNFGLKFMHYQGGPILEPGGLGADTDLDVVPRYEAMRDPLMAQVQRDDIDWWFEPNDTSDIASFYVHQWFTARHHRFGMTASTEGYHDLGGIYSTVYGALVEKAGGDVSSIPACELNADGSSVTGVDVVEQVAVTLAPNPTSGSVSVSWESGDATIVVRDAAGIVVLTSSGSEGSAQVDVSSLNSGLYIISVNGEGSAKLIIE